MRCAWGRAMSLVQRGSPSPWASSSSASWQSRCRLLFVVKQGRRVVAGQAKTREAKTGVQTVGWCGIGDGAQGKAFGRLALAVEQAVVVFGGAATVLFYSASCSIHLATATN